MTFLPVSRARTQAGLLPASPGVYRFRDGSGGVLYIGRAVNLRRRVLSYWGDLRERRHLAGMVRDVAAVEAVACASAHEAAWLERNLLRRSVPPYNRSGEGGQEAEVWIRLSESARAPGLRVVYERRPGDNARYFGPYLGGRRVREAVAGISRVLPLDYAGDGGRGTTGELARVRGASPANRRELTLWAAKTLERDPPAIARVRAGLASRRNAAAANLSFELAAKLQAELAALEWVTATQLVTSQEPADFDVSGWSGGVLVTFEIRGGRLSGWEQRHAVRRGRPAAATPEWAAFALRNAVLAASLAR